MDIGVRTKQEARVEHAVALAADGLENAPQSALLSAGIKIH